MNRAQHNRHQHNQGAAALSGVGVQNPFYPYRLESRTGGGALVAPLWQWTNAKTKDTINAHGDVSFDYPYTADAWAYFASGRQVWVRDDRGAVRY